MKYIIVLFAFMLLKVSASAQIQQPDPVKRKQALVEQLDITMEKAAELIVVLDKFNPRFEELQRSRLEINERMKLIRQLNEEKNDAVKIVLTEEQYKKYLERMQQREEAHKKRVMREKYKQ